ncbi:MAG: anti-sigma factor [Thermoactinomyces sp.]
MNSDCKEMEFLIQLYVDGEIKKDELQRLERHLNECRQCRDELDQLVQLVNSLEQLGERERELIKSRLLNWVKRTVVIASILLFSFTSPLHTNPKPIYSGEKVVEGRLTVLATGQETVYIPEHKIIQCLKPNHWTSSISGTALIYPCAVPAFIKRKHSLNKTNRIIFVRVSDPVALKGLFSTIGLSRENVKKTVEFPVSVMVKLSSKPEVSVFKFTKTEEGVRRWYENWTNQILQTSY